MGIFGAVLALTCLYGVLFYLDGNFPELGLMDDIAELLLVFGGVFLLGVAIATISTFFATQRFLNLRTDDLYY